MHTLYSDLLAHFPVDSCQCAGHQILITCAPLLPVLHGTQGLEDTTVASEMKAIHFGSGAGVAGTDHGQSLIEVEKIPPMFVSHHLPFD